MGVRQPQNVNTYKPMLYQELLRAEKIAHALTRIDTLQQLPEDTRFELVGKLINLFSQETYTGLGVGVLLVLSCPHKFMDAGYAAMRTTNRNYGGKLSAHAVCVGDILDPYANDGFGSLNHNWNISIPQVIFCIDKLTVYIPAPEFTQCG